MTSKQKVFTKELAKNGGNKVQAALKAYDTDNYKAASVIADHNLKNPDIQSALKMELKKQNITLERAVQPISEALNDEDIDVRLKGSDRALKLLLPKEKSSVDLSFNIDSAHFGGQFVGGVVDE